MNEIALSPSVSCLKNSVVERGEGGGKDDVSEADPARAAVADRSHERRADCCAPMDRALHPSSSASVKLHLCSRLVPIR